MLEHDKNNEELNGQFIRSPGEAFAAAREEALATGNSVVESADGHIREVFPDGRCVILKDIPPATSNVPGRKITIR